MELSEILRVGTVVTKDSVNMRCRVLFPDTPTNPVVTALLPVLVNRAHDDTYYDLPDIGSTVLCAFTSPEQGFILGSFYPLGKSPCTDENIYQHKFKDGTYIEYDRNSHKLTASCVGDAEVLAEGNIEITGDNVSIFAKNILSLQAAQIIAQE